MCPDRTVGRNRKEFFSFEMGLTFFINYNNIEKENANVSSNKEKVIWLKTIN